MGKNPEVATGAGTTQSVEDKHLYAIFFAFCAVNPHTVDGNRPHENLNLLFYHLCYGRYAHMIRLSMRLKELRREKGLRQAQIAALVGVTKSAVSAWESDIRQPPYDTLIRLADIYGVSTDYLLGRCYDRLLDLSGLTAAEAALICQLVETMKQKNKKLEEF